MILPSMIEATKAHYEEQRQLSEKAYAQQLNIAAGEGWLQRLVRRLRKSSAGEKSGHRRPALEGINTQHPPAYSK